MTGFDTIDGIFIVVLTLGGVAIVAALVMRRNGVPDRSRTANAWLSGIARICVDGRELIDMTAAADMGDSGIGLTVAQLSLIETKLDLLLGRISDLQSTAPTPDAVQRLGLAESHALSLNEAVRTERRVRLSSTPSAMQKLDTIALQFVSERSSLDHVLGEICRDTKAKTERRVRGVEDD